MHNDAIVSAPAAPCVWACRMFNACTPSHPASMQQGRDNDHIRDAPRWINSIEHPCGEAQPSCNPILYFFLDESGDLRYVPLRLMSSRLYGPHGSQFIEADGCLLLRYDQ